MLGLAQTQTHEIMKASLSHSGRATVKCPFCNKCHCITVPKHLHNKPVRAECECGKSFPVLFDSRGYYRKEVRLSGEYEDIFGKKDTKGYYDQPETWMSYYGKASSFGYGPEAAGSQGFELTILELESKTEEIEKSIVSFINGDWKKFKEFVEENPLSLLKE